MSDNAMNTRSWIATIVGIVMFFAGAVLALEARVTTETMAELKRVQLDHSSRIQILEKASERNTVIFEYIKEKIDLINDNLTGHIKTHLEGRIQ
jgi:hypothetical protein